jgi:2-methylfumaryl-CoA isomerase
VVAPSSGSATRRDQVSPPRPLDGLRVVEVSSYVAAPLAGLVLAQLGAEVIRVDPPGGAPDRTRWPLAASGASLYWAGLNAGKRSVELDLTDPGDREQLIGLVASGGDGGGILLTNNGSSRVPGMAELAARRGDVIRIQLTGRPDGRSAVDYTVNAGSGFAAITGPVDHAEPVNHALPAWDVACGLYVAVGLLAAERARRRTGRGAELRIALSDVALATATNLGLLAEAELTGVARPKVGNAVYGTYVHWFATADEQRLIVVALTRRHWRELVALTGTGGAVAGLERGLGADFDSESDRYRHRRVLDALLAPWFEERDCAQVTAALSDGCIPWARFATFDEVVAGGELARNPIVGRVGSPGIAEHFAAGSPLVFDGTPFPAAPAPQLGGDRVDRLVHEART